MWKYFVKTILYCNVRNISELKKATYVKNCQLSSLKLSNFRTAETPLSKLLDWANSETNETKKGTFRNHSPFIYANEMNSKSENQLFRIWHKQLQNEPCSRIILYQLHNNPWKDFRNWMLLKLPFLVSEFAQSSNFRSFKEFHWK